MLCADMLVRKARGFFRRISKHTFPFVAERQVHGRGNFFVHNPEIFYLFMDSFYLALTAQETIGERFILTQQTEQKVLGLNIRAAKLAGLISGKKDYAPGLLSIFFKHRATSCTSASHCTKRGVILT